MKLSKNLQHSLLLLIIIIGIGCLTKYMINPLREGIIFTPYDNKTLFTKHWSQFCLQPPPSCNKSSPASMLGAPPIGCNCEGIGNAGNLDPKCDGTEHLYFFR